MLLRQYCQRITFVTYLHITYATAHCAYYGLMIICAIIYYPPRLSESILEYVITSYYYIYYYINACFIGHSIFHTRNTSSVLLLTDRYYEGSLLSFSVSNLHDSVASLAKFEEKRTSIKYILNRNRHSRGDISIHIYRKKERERKKYVLSLPIYFFLKFQLI